MRTNGQPGDSAKYSRLRLYEPKISFSSIYSPNPANMPMLKYNHDADVVKYRNRYIACWNANESAGEHKPGQYNYLSWSDDFISWSKPIRPFTAEAGAVFPVEDDNQWQPSLINYHDNLLFCAWCTYNGGKTFISSSEDGIHWTNREVAAAPPKLMGKAVGFPTTHGLLTSRDVMMFPCSLPYTGNFVVGDTRYAAVLYSEDRGQNWKWSEPVEGMRWEEISKDPVLLEKETMMLWEPVLFEQGDGRIGLLVRNATFQDDPRLIERQSMEQPHHMVLYACSEDHGRTWSKARPIEVDSVCSRPFAVSCVHTPDSLITVMNDNWVNVPKRISADRYHLSLYVSPVADPDLLLPGPLVQPEGGRAFYPNGFTDNGRLYLAYTYSGIHSTVVDELPDFSEPFLMPRASRSGLWMDNRTAIIGQKHSGLGLVLTKELIEKPRLHLSFELSICRYSVAEFPLITLGGKTRNGSLISAVYSEELGLNCIRLKLTDNRVYEGCAFQLQDKLQFSIAMSMTDFIVIINDELLFEGNVSLLRKIGFGGLYSPPEWPAGTTPISEVRLDLDSIIVY